MCSVTVTTIIIHMYLSILLTILYIYYITHVQHYFDALCKCKLHHACALIALILVLRSDIRIGWLIYLVVWPNEVMSGRLVKMCSVGYNNWKCCIDTWLTFQALSCTSNALSKLLLQILKLTLYFEWNACFGVWFFIKTRSPILKSVLSRSLIGGSICLLQF